MLIINISQGGWL